MSTNSYPYPTETIDLPSKGLVYPENHPLSSGFVDIKYMTSKEEDILTNMRLIENQTAIQKLLESVIVTPGVVLDDMIAGDKDAVLLATRILGLGSNYSFDYNYKGKVYKPVVDLSKIEYKLIDETKFVKGVNEFAYSFSNGKMAIKYKLLTGKDEKNIRQELKGLQKLNPDFSGEISITLKYTITEVNGNRDTASIRKFVDSGLIIKDSREFKNHLEKNSPGVDLKFSLDLGNDEIVEGLRIPMTVSFFWPEFES